MVRLLKHIGKGFSKNPHKAKAIVVELDLLYGVFQIVQREESLHEENSDLELQVDRSPC
jgi:hypothetical protein